MPDVPAETAYDVLHDTEYRKKWDLNVLDTHEIARLSDNADVGYYACEWGWLGKAENNEMIRPGKQTVQYRQWCHQGHA